MVGQEKRPLKVFLCHASGDKPAVRQLYKRLVVEGVDAWLDQEKLLPGQDWRLEIPKAVREADVVVICLSNRSITKEGYIQKEIRFALDIAEEKPEGTIFVIPARLEDCPVPERLNRWQWVDLFDDNGSVKLLRSLRMRADMAGAVIEPLPYEDKEFEQRIEQLYTEGLAAFWVEDWDKACHRFQTILSERPSHAGAAEKLEEAERQRNLAKLYSKAVEAQKNQDWLLVISTLEDLLKKDSAYKDAGAMLKTAREEQQLKALYAEAKTLHAAQKWEAVIKVFEQISSLEKSFVDPENLLASAQKEVAELQRLARLKELYSNAIHKMDSGEWYEARALLEQVHKTRTGFSETEKLLSKVETEIRQSEDEKKRQDQINTLYEQAHGLLRSKKWRKALDKIEEIRILDEKFEDPEKIAEQAQKELAREEQEAERQNELSAMYAEAVRLVREEKYQDALEKWHEIRGIDSKYPDRQKVQRMAKKSLVSLAKPVTKKPRIIIPKSLWIGPGVIVTIVIILLAFKLSGNNDEKPLSPVIPTSTSVSDGKIVVRPTETMVVSSSTLENDLLYKEDFETGKASNWSLDSGWQVAKDGSNYVLSGEGFQFAMYKARNELANYSIRFKLKLIQGAIHLDYRRIDRGADENGPGKQSQGYWVGFHEDYLNFSKIISGNWKTLSEKNIDFALNAWHDIEIVNDGNVFLIYIDGTLAMQYQDTDPVQEGTFWFVTLDDSKALIDNIEVEPSSSLDTVSDPTMYDDFENSLFDGNFNNSLWRATIYSPKSVIKQLDGSLTIEVYGQTSAGLHSKTNLSITKPTFIEMRAYLDPTTTDIESHLYMGINTDQGETVCGVFGYENIQDISCWSNYYEKMVNPSVGLERISPNWHVFRFEIEPETMTIFYLIDGIQVGKFVPKDMIPDHYNDFRNKTFTFRLALNNNGPSTAPVGYIDYVRIGAIEDDPSKNTTSATGTTSTATQVTSGYTDAQKALDNEWLYGNTVQKIVFNSDRDGNREIYVMDVKGEKVVRLTYDDSDDWSPAWSPNDSTIAFTSNRSGNQDIYLMDLDGSNIRNLTNNSAGDSSPSWSPDGSKIAFSSDRSWNGDIYTMNSDGSNLTCIVYDDASDWGPSWSPYESKIAYSTNAYGTDAAIVMVNSDGREFQIYPTILLVIFPLLVTRR